MSVDIDEAELAPTLQITRLDLRFEPRPWPFAEERRAEIDARFIAMQRDKSALYNGRVLLMHRRRIQRGVLQGAYLETDFASFLIWRDLGNPGPPMWNCFAQGALRASDGGYLLGVMGDHTANAGRIYFPSGTPDPSDIVGNMVDLDASLGREVFEETGLVAADYQAAPTWTCVLAGPRMALIKTLQLPESAAEARARIRGVLARQEEPELADMYIVRDANDLSDRMPDFIQTYFKNLWGLD